MVGGDPGFVLGPRRDSRCYELRSISLARAIVLPWAVTRFPQQGGRSLRSSPDVDIGGGESIFAVSGAPGRSYRADRRRAEESEGRQENARREIVPPGIIE